MLKKLLRAIGARRGQTQSAAPAGWVEQQLDKLACGKIEEVEQEAREVCAREPRCAEAYYLAGKTLLARRKFGAAAAELRQAIAIEPGQAEFHHELGHAARGLGEKSEALASFERALAIRNDYVSAAYYAGVMHGETGDVEEARDRLSLALDLDPLSSAARTDLARLLMDQGEPEAALDLLREAVTRGIADVAVYSWLARLLLRAGDAGAAEETYSAAIERFPGDAALLVNFGMLKLGQLGDASAAEALFRSAIEIDPASVEAQANLGLSLQEQGRFDEAIEHYERQLLRQPRVLEYRWNRGLVNLIRGNFGAGWPDYELRKSRPDAGGVHEKFTLPDWDGSPLRGRSVLIYGEQGIGDEIMFASCLPDVIAQAGSCVIECDARLESLYRRSFPQARIAARTGGRERDWRATYPDLEVQCAIASLPRFLRRSESDFPAHGGYLVADGAASARWGARLEAFGNAPRVGISWRGGTLRTRGALRSLALADLGELFDLEGISFVVLQRGLTDEERAEIAARKSVIVPESVADLDELAALVRSLGLVISVPTTTVHVAGALGQPVWILLTRSPEWRYLWQGDRMPWYPTATLLRQARGGGWRDVVRETFARLQEWKR